MDDFLALLAASVSELGSDQMSSASGFWGRCL